jgi:hypothetical protein
LQIGISITKSVLFRGVQQEFSNTYHYQLSGAVTAPYDALVEEIVAVERQLHSTDVAFVRAAVWSSGGTKEQNQMLYQKPLTGFGSTATITQAMDRERAFLIMWPAGVNVLGKPVYLRKWYHSCGIIAGYSPLSSALIQTASIPQTNRDAIATKAGELTNIGVGETWDLCAESGRVWEALPTCHPWIEHHQLGDMWR